jgi:hypothetical protein
MDEYASCDSKFTHCQAPDISLSAYFQGYTPLSTASVPLHRARQIAHTACPSVSDNRQTIDERIANKYYEYMNACTSFRAHYGAYLVRHSSDRKKKNGTKAVERNTTQIWSPPTLKVSEIQCVLEVAVHLDYGTLHCIVITYASLMS